MYQLVSGKVNGFLVSLAVIDNSVDCRVGDNKQEQQVTRDYLDKHGRYQYHDGPAEGVYDKRRNIVETILFLWCVFFPPTLLFEFGEAHWL